MYDLHTKEIFVSRDVRFVKYELPFASRILFLPHHLASQSQLLPPL